MLISKNNQRVPVEIIAHRGASFLAPENTLESINLAWQLNADAVEIDIRFSLDEKPVVIHDATTKRTTGKNLTVSKTSSEELRKLDAGAFKHNTAKQQKIPFLEEVIATIPQGKKLFIEIKFGAETLPNLRTIIERNGKINRFIIIGFDLQTISLFKECMPEIPAYWLRDITKHRITKKAIPHNHELITTAKKHNLDGLNVQYSGITKDFAEEVLSNGLKLYAWTVNDIEIAEHLIKLGVDGITTDNPGLIMKEIGEI